MFKISTESLPKLIINDLAYLIYYSIYWFLISILFILPLSKKYLEWFTLNSDYEMLMFSLILWVIIWIIYKLFSTPIEKKIIKRNIFVAWLITILKKHKSIAFKDIIKNYSYFISQNRKVISRDKEWSSYIEALIALWIIDLKNEKSLKDKNKDFDYKYFNNNLFEVELILKDRDVDTDELIKKLDNYVL
jgi:hypothetical protein